MYGLVLEGGGAKGSYHIGVYKAIMEMGFEIGGIVGSSIGALNGAMIAQGDYERCKELWENISYSMVFDINDDEIKKIKALTLNIEDIKVLGEGLRHLISNGGIDIAPIKKIMDENVDEDRIRKSKIDFGIVTVNLTGLKPVEIFLEDIAEGGLKNYLLASAYLPIFKFERIDGDLYLDGGFYDNLPHKMLLKKGYKDLILVRTNAPGVTKRLNIEGVNSIVVSPSEDIGKTYLYEAENARKNIRLGYLDGLRVFKGLLGKKYYIEAEGEEDSYLDFFLRLNEQEVEEMEKLLKLEKMPYRRSIFESIAPKLFDYLFIDKSHSYKDLIIDLLEKIAWKYDIDRYRVYKFEELLEAVGDAIGEEKKKEELDEREMILKGIDLIIEKVESFKIFNREEILLGIGKILFNPKN